ncbi:N utilization substance protein B, partial [Paenibacillus macerans]
LVTGVKDHQIVLYETIKPHLKDWSIDRLLKSDRIILRMATFEILHSDTPKKVVVNEAVELTKQFSDDDHYKFVNGVLSNIND